ncbi:MAG: alanine--tRNA ligase [Gemmatales bacterium]|nr:alanine--tRNA ligase [Gemmatales bacterium]MDW8224046.1 alanine--tRNA ligase [Gemmatales bacterium]
MPGGKEIRQQFIDYFVKEHGHTFVPSSSVVPVDDPTLMFTNAGMNQFKDVFLGTGTRPYRRAVNSQKCIRVSGKHNDLEEVGRDTYHHTFFEMLGNWSFGDYYKAEAITWAWDLLTRVWGIEKARLHATVFAGDDKEGLEADEEAYRLWLEMTDIDPTHVHRFGKKDNFWMMGETGPCGPCTEIHIDRTPDKSGGKLINRGDPRVIEIWNLVFIQYNRDESGKLHLLPAKHVDTGMGFERITAILQGKDSNYDTDIFAPLIAAIGELTGKRYRGSLTDLVDIGFRVIADHIRMLTFAITDGALPGNKGRGSVVRSILRRAMRFGWEAFDRREPFLYRLVPVVVEHMGEAFPELKYQPQRVMDVIRREEEDFLRTIERGLRYFAQAVSRARPVSPELRAAEQIPEGIRGILSGKDVFELHTTYGFPPDMTRQMARERSLLVDEAEYARLMAEHEEKSRAQPVAQQVALHVHEPLPSTDDRAKWFGLTGQGTILGWIETNRFFTTGRLEARGEEASPVGLVLDRTCFYAEAGGQVGDCGYITTNTGTFEVTDTQWLGQTVVHLGTVTAGYIAPGQLARLQVDSIREFTRKNHTATHLLHWALRQVLGEHVEQRGSKVKPEGFTFDFSHVGPMRPEERMRVEELVNEKIYQDLPVTWRELPIEQARKLPGVRAFFGDKYGEVVRIVEIGDGFSREFCGGTHVDHTGQIGPFLILSEEGLGKGIRRVTCTTARQAVLAMQRYERLLGQLSAQLRCSADELPMRLEALQEEIKRLQQQLRRAATTDLNAAADRLLQQAEDYAGVKVIVGEMPSATEEQIRQQADRLRQKAGSAVVVLGWTDDTRVQLLAALTQDLVERGLHAGNLLRQVAPAVGGGGGGKPQFAVAGGREPAKLPEALQLARRLIHKYLTGA